MQTLPLPFIGKDAVIRIIDWKPRKMKLISVIDVIKALSGKDDVHSESEFCYICRFAQEIHSKCIKFKFPGDNQRDTPVTDLETTLLFMRHVYGISADKHRERTAEWLRRFLAGDPTLQNEIDHMLSKLGCMPVQSTQASTCDVDSNASRTAVRNAPRRTS